MDMRTHDIDSDGLGQVATTGARSFSPAKHDIEPLGVWMTRAFFTVLWLLLLYPLVKLVVP